MEKGMIFNTFAFIFSNRSYGLALAGTGILLILCLIFILAFRRKKSERSKKDSLKNKGFNHSIYDYYYEGSKASGKIKRDEDISDRR